MASFKEKTFTKKSAELGYWLGEPFWGQGIMTRAVRLLCEEAFRYAPGRADFAEPFAANLGSRRVLENAGFRLEGLLKDSVFKNGLLQDSCIYARTLSASAPSDFQSDHR